MVQLSPLIQLWRLPSICWLELLICLPVLLWLPILCLGWLPILCSGWLQILCLRLLPILSLGLLPILSDWLPSSFLVWSTRLILRIEVWLSLIWNCLSRLPRILWVSPWVLLLGLIHLVVLGAPIRRGRNWLPALRWPLVHRLWLGYWSHGLNAWLKLRPWKGLLLLWGLHWCSLRSISIRIFFVQVPTNFFKRAASMTCYFSFFGFKTLFRLWRFSLLLFILFKLILDLLCWFLSDFCFLKRFLHVRILG